MEVTTIIREAIQNKTPISFSKYGDGEFFCASSVEGHNCDNDNYTEKKKNGLLDSFKYMVQQTDNAYIGMWTWNDGQQPIFWQGLVESTPVKWGDYHTLILNNDNVEEKVKLYKEIKKSSMKKIIVCNELLVKAKILFDIDHVIHVPFNNWFDNQFDSLLNQIKEIIEGDEQQFIVITSAGMGAKILICELCKLFPNNIYLDFGSALDKICTKRVSRGWEPSYDELIRRLSEGEVIPENWNDPVYDYIYPEARWKLGIHLPYTEL